MIIKKEGHEHKFEIEEKKKVLLNAGEKTAVDIIYQRKCSKGKCGAIQAYDLERTVK